MTASTVKSQALNLINEYCGSSAYKMYGNFYQDLSDDQIKVSVEQLLKEVVGNTKTKKLLVQAKIKGN